jgi:UDP-N-acetylglucosamine acyltransferase
MAENAAAPDVRIHPLATVEPGARLGAGVTIGPFCTVGPDVTLADGVTLISHVAVAGRTKVGARTRVFPFASLGHEPQDLKYRGEASTLEIGADCTVREGVTMNPGTAQGGLATRVGHHGTFLANAHVAHDCQVGDHVVFSNNVMLAGHCQVGSHVILGGGAAVHQFVRIGRNSFVGGLAGVEHDVIPYGMALGNRAYLAGLNVVGLKRHGFAREQIHELRHAYKALFGPEGTLKDRLDGVVETFGQDAAVSEIVDFIRAGGDRAICVPRDAARADNG